MNTKWINGIEEGRPTETAEKRNAGDGGGERTKTKRTTSTKGGTHKKSEKPRNLDLVARRDNSTSHIILFNIIVFIPTK